MTLARPAAMLASLLLLLALRAPAATTPPHPPLDPTPAAPAKTAADTRAASVHDLTAADVGAWLDGLLPFGLKNGDIAGAEVSIVKDGKLLFEGGYGFADVANKVPMDPERHMMRIGSTSKLFTWTAVMQLVEQHKLDLGRNVDDYLDFKVSPAGGKPITLVDLMNHRGGFEEGLKDVLALDPKALQTTETYLKQHPRPLLFPAGEVPAYSNYGTALAGYIVQRVSGEPYERYIEKHILEPLGMRHATFEQPLPARFEGMAATGYRTASGPGQPYELVTTAPAGSANISAADMAQFMLAHLQGGRLGEQTILAPETAALMHTPSETALPGFGTMAHGFFHEVRNGRTMIGHGGDSIFFHTELQLLPEDGVGIFYSFNSRGRDQSVYGLRRALLDEFMERYFPSRETLAQAPSLATARDDAGKIAARYETSRRIEHGFLSVFYRLQQTVISANEDGTISTPKAFEPGEARFRETAPNLWHEIGGTRQLALRSENGRNTVLDSEDPTSVMQAVSLPRSAALNLTVLIGSLTILLATLLLWPLLALVRRHYGRPALVPALRRPRLLLRVAALAGLLWLLAWAKVLSPIIDLQVDYYSGAHDPLIRSLQIAGLLIIVLAVLSVLGVPRVWKAERAWAPRIGNLLIAVAMIGLVWIGYAGGLMSFTLNY